MYVACSINAKKEPLFLRVLKLDEGKQMGTWIHNALKKHKARKLTQPFQKTTTQYCYIHICFVHNDKFSLKVSLFRSKLFPCRSGNSLAFLLISQVNKSHYLWKWSLRYTEEKKAVSLSFNIRGLFQVLCLALMKTIRHRPC